MSEFLPRFTAADFSFPRSNSSEIDVESWLLLADEERIRVADNPPAIRPSLRREFFEELVAIEVRRERVRRVSVALMVCVAFLCVAYLPRFKPAEPVARRAPAEARRDQVVAPMTSEASWCRRMATFPSSPTFVCPADVWIFEPAPSTLTLPTEPAPPI